MHVLTYHKIDTRRELGVNTVSPARFEAHLRALLALGLRPVDMSAALSGIAGPASDDLTAAASVHLTFDDGYANFLTHAWPLCVQYGFPATVFPIAGYVGRSNSWDLTFPRTPHLGWSDLRALADAGVTIGAHTVTHPFLSRIAPKAAKIEIEESKARVEDGIGGPVDVFAYPHGDSSPLVRQLVEDAGYDAAFALDSPGGGATRDRWRAPRTAIYSIDSPGRVAAKVGARGPGAMRRAGAVSRAFRMCGYAGLLVPHRWRGAAPQARG
jgi:peptidoglycan/xylan/chitin deacetylase (PgdA/CDA1 family)